MAARSLYISCYPRSGLAHFVRMNVRVTGNVNPSIRFAVSFHENGWILRVTHFLSQATISRFAVPFQGMACGKCVNANDFLVVTRLLSLFSALPGT